MAETSHNLMTTEGSRDIPKIYHNDQLQNPAIHEHHTHPPVYHLESLLSDSSSVHIYLKCAVEI